MVTVNNKEWSNLLPLVTLVHNNLVKSTTRLAPNQLLTGQEPTIMPAQSKSTENPLAEECVQQLKERQTMVTQALNQAAQKHMPGPARWIKGQQVWLDMKNLALPYRTIKLAPKRHGPFTIDKVISLVVYQLRLPSQWNIHPIFHASLLTPYIKMKEHSQNFMRPPPNMIKGEEQYKVEAIRSHRHHQCKLQYLIKWKGYPESDNTWEPIDNVQAPQLIRKYHLTHPLEDKRMNE